MVALLDTVAPLVLAGVGLALFVVGAVLPRRR